MRAFCAVSGLLLIAAPALAQENGPPPSTADFARLELFLQAAARQARDARHANLAAGVIAGIVLLPTGLVLAHSDDALLQETGIGMAFAGGIPLGFSLLSLWPSTMEDFQAAFEARLFSGMSQAELMRITLHEWHELAITSRSRRIKVGIGEAVLGIVAAAVGIGFLSEHQVGNLSRNTQTTAGSVLVGSGLPFIQLGFRSLLQRSPQETWWDALSQDEGMAQ